VAADATTTMTTPRIHGIFLVLLLAAAEAFRSWALTRGLFHEAAGAVADGFPRDSGGRAFLEVHSIPTVHLQL